MLAVGRSRGRDGPGGPAGPRRRRRRHRHRRRGRRSPSSWSAGSDEPAARRRSSTDRAAAGCRCGRADEAADIRAGRHARRLAPRLPAPGRPRRRVDVPRRATRGGRAHIVRGATRARLDRLLRPARGRPRTACPRPRSATAWSRRPAAGASPPRRCARVLVETDRAGVRVRASVEPDQHGQHPGARQVRVHRAARQQRRRRAGDGPAAARDRPAAGRHRPRRHPGPQRRHRLGRTPRDVLAAVEALGVPVVFVTGRPLRWTEEVFEYVGEHGLAIVCNGALVWDVAPAPAAPRAADRAGARPRGVPTLLREAVPGTSFAVETLDGIGLEPEFLERAPGARRRPPRARSTSSSTRPRSSCWPGTRSSGRRSSGTPPRRSVQRPAGDHLVLGDRAARDQRRRASPRPPRSALLCADLGVDAADVIAFGDMPNDLPMLAWAGTSYAMANAHPTVLEAADHVAPGQRRRRRRAGAGWCLRPVIC